MNLDSYIRKIPDFPKTGILYYDITGILTAPEAFSFCIETMLKFYEDQPFAAVAAIESRGFLLAPIFAQRYKIPLILIRKAGKLPGETLKKSYELEYGTAELELHPHDVPRGGQILLLDDLIATGGTLRAAAALLRDAGAEVRHIFGLIGLRGLGFAEKLPSIEVKTLINY